MNDDVFAGQWKQMRGSLKSWWGRLTEDDLERVGGEKDKLVGLVQERYAQTREEAEREVERRFSEYGNGGIGANLKTRASALGANVSNKASEAAHRLSTSVDSARSYFQDRSVDELTSDLVGVVRKYPIQACLVGLGIGYMVTKSIAGRDELEEAIERKDNLIGSLRRKYRQTRADVEREAERRLDEYGDVGAKLKESAGELGASVANKASEAVDRLSSSVGSARSYFQERNVDELTGDLRDVIRKYPIYACLVGLGVGLLAKSMVGSGDRHNPDR
ncbi:MAG: CsbD family protein [Candidatus Binatia bacterium]